MTFNEWKSQAVGRHIDVDGAYGAQCVDVYLDYIQKVIGVDNWSSVSGWGDAAALYPKANQAYFTKFDSSGIPRTGDVIFYGPTSTNSAGHVAIVDSADSTGVTCIEQDGFNPGGVCYIKFRPWNGRCIGWQRPNNLVISSQGGDEVANRDQVNNLYKGILFRDGDEGGLNNYTGRDANTIVAEMLGSGERKELEAHFNNLSNAVSSMQQTIDTLSQNPTKAEYAAVQAQLNETVKALDEERKKIKTETKYVTDDQTRDNVNKILAMVTSIFDYFKGQYKSFTKYIRK